MVAGCGCWLLAAQWVPEQDSELLPAPCLFIIVSMSLECLTPSIDLISTMTMFTGASLSLWWSCFCRKLSAWSEPLHATPA